MFLVFFKYMARFLENVSLLATITLIRIFFLIYFRLSMSLLFKNNYLKESNKIEIHT